MSGPPQGPPPDWYEDPSGDGGWRYWNGAAWTSRAAGYEAPSTGSLPTSGHPETGESGPQSPSAMPARTERSPEQAQGGFAALWESAGGVVTCTGCTATSGAPGALCPACGSRYPSPRALIIGLVVAAAGSLGIAIDWIATGEFFGFGPQTEDFAGFGMLLALAGGGLAVYGSGRIGPEQQQSCCGCSCAVALIALPVAALALWVTGGPALVLIALPAWVPLLRVLDWTWRLAMRVSRVLFPLDANMRSCRSRGATTRGSAKPLSKATSPTVRSTLSSLPPLTLEDALSVALLICGSEPENAERAAVRWLRKLLDRPGVRLADVRQALDAFALLVEDAASAEATLTELAATHR